MNTPNGTDTRSGSAAVAQLASQLRELRLQAGAPSFRRLAQITHYAPSTLAEATRGVRLPTEQVVRSFAAACGADEQVWAEHWRVALVARQDELRPVPADDDAVEDVVDDVVEVLPDAAVLTEVLPPVERTDTRHWPIRARTAVLAGVAAALCALTGGMVAAAINRAQTPTAAARVADAVSSAAPVGSVRPNAATVPPGPNAGGRMRALQVDGEDPAGSGCTGDGTVLARATLSGDAAITGVLELRYSPSCGAVWAQIASAPQPTLSWPAHSLAQVTVSVSDGRASSFTYPVLPISTQVLQIGQFCARAQAVVHDPDTRQDASAQTDCLTA